MESLAAALVFVWLGMVLAISFMEAPLKFRAPGLELRVGLAVGRIVFRALNTAEVALGVAIAVALLAGDPETVGVVGYLVAAVVLIAQLAAVRPALKKRSDAVLAGHEGPRSHAHFWYVGLEVVKVAALVVAGAGLLA